MPTITNGRHTFASLMDSAGANDVCIKLIMGHSMKTDTTKGTYTHKILEDLLTEVNKILNYKSRLIAGYTFDVSYY